MPLIKKLLVTLVGGCLLLLGLILLVLPGPAVLIIPLALAVLAIEYPQAKRWLVVFQRKMSTASAWLDRTLRRLRHSRYNRY